MKRKAVFIKDIEGIRATKYPETQQPAEESLEKYGLA